MDASKRLVNLFFVVGALLAWMIFGKLFSTVFLTFGVRDLPILGRAFTLSTCLGIVAALAVVFLAWHSKYRVLAQEVSDELVKVTWPTWTETRNNTKVTIITAVILAVILWIFDQVFGNLTRLILGG